MRILVIQRLEGAPPTDDTVLDITVPSCAPDSPDMFVPDGATYRTSYRDGPATCTVYVFRLPPKS